MVRIRVQNSHDAVSGPDTPIVAGELEFEGQKQTVYFLIDTGAAITAINSQFIDCTAEVWGKGAKHEAHGVGIASWPSKLFQNATLTLKGDSGQDLQLALSHMVVWAPYVDKDHRARTTSFTPGRGGNVPHQPCRTPNLLGRNAFSQNRLALHWNPSGDSYIEVLEEAPVAPMVRQQSNTALPKPVGKV